MGSFNRVGSNAYDSRAFDICIIDFASMQGNNITLYTLPSLEAIKQLQQQRSDVRLNELLLKWDALCSRDIKTIVPVRYDRTSNQIRVPKNFTRESHSREFNIQVVSEYDNLINSLQDLKSKTKQDVKSKAKTNDSEVETKATPEVSAESPVIEKTESPVLEKTEAAKAPTQVAKAPIQVAKAPIQVAKAPIQVATVVELSDEEEAEIQAEFEELVSAIHAVSLDTLKKKSDTDTNGATANSQVSTAQGRSTTRVQHKHKNVDVAVEDTYAKSDSTASRKREREEETSPTVQKRKRSEKLTKDLDEDARLRQVAVKKDELKREIRDGK